MLAFVSIICKDSLLYSYCLILSHINFKTPVILMGVEVLFNCLVLCARKLLIAWIM